MLLLLFALSKLDISAPVLTRNAVLPRPDDAALPAPVTAVDHVVPSFDMGAVGLADVLAVLADGEECVFEEERRSGKVEGAEGADC